MCENLFNPSELKFLWKHRGDKNYDLKSFISNGNFIQYVVFEDLRSFRKVLGKIVTAPKEGEAYHWPRLHHENLLPLIDIVSINEKISIYISPLIGSNLKTIIHSEEFVIDSKCFLRKKAYAEDILWALDYLHSKSLCLMNLTEECVQICGVSDKAVICDFTHLFLVERASEEKLALPTLYQPPEVKTKCFDAVSVETWACGVMLLQIFTKHYLPSAFIGEEARQVMQAVKEISYEMIKEAHPRTKIYRSEVEELREFLQLFLTKNPNHRSDVRIAATAPFLKSSLRLTKPDKSNPCKKFLKSGVDVEQHWKSYRLNWVNSNFKCKNVETFKDIYQKEIASCREKLKKLPCTNKFINLDFVQNNGSKNLQKNKGGKTIFKDKKKDFDEKKEIDTYNSQLCSQKPIICDDEIKLNNETQNLFSDAEEEHNFPHLEQISDFGDMKLDVTSESKTHMSNLHNESCDINTTQKGTEVCNEEVLNSKSESSLENVNSETMNLTESEQSNSPEVPNILNNTVDNSNSSSPKENSERFMSTEQETKILAQNLNRRNSELAESQSFNKINVEASSTSNVAYLQQSDPNTGLLKGARIQEVNHTLSSSCSREELKSESSFENHDIQQMDLTEFSRNILKCEQSVSLDVSYLLNSSTDNLTSNLPEQINEELIFAQPETNYSRQNLKSSKSENADFNAINIEASTISDIAYQWQSDTDVLKDEGNQEVSPALPPFCTNQEGSDQITIQDSPNTKINSGHCKDNSQSVKTSKWNIELSNSRGTLATEDCGSCITDKNFATSDNFINQQVPSNHDEVFFNAKINPEFKNEDVSSNHQVTENNIPLEIEFPTDKCQIKSKFNRTNSYEFAIKKGLRRSRAPETKNTVKGHLKTENWSLKKFLPQKNRSTNGKNCKANQKEPKKNGKERDSVLTIRDILFDDDHNTISNNLDFSILSFSENNFLSSTTNSAVKRKKKNTKRNWIHFLCLGSRN